jgi:hypothetical protein
VSLVEKHGRKNNAKSMSFLAPIRNCPVYDRIQVYHVFILNHFFTQRSWVKLGILAGKAERFGRLFRAHAKKIDRIKEKQNMHDC